MGTQITMTNAQQSSLYTLVEQNPALITGFTRKQSLQNIEQQLGFQVSMHRLVAISVELGLVFAKAPRGLSAGKTENNKALCFCVILAKTLRRMVQEGGLREAPHLSSIIARKGLDEVDQEYDLWAREDLR